MGSYVLIRDEEIEAVDSRNLAIEENEAEPAKHLSQLKFDEGKIEANLTDVKERLASLDVFRGLTVALMILVDDAGGALPAINHSPWNGVTLADFVMPFFLFIVGVSLGLVYKRVSDKIVATRKAILRSIKLFVLGIVLQAQILLECMLPTFYTGGNGFQGTGLQSPYGSCLAVSTNTRKIVKFLEYLVHWMAIDTLQEPWKLHEDIYKTASNVPSFYLFLLRGHGDWDYYITYIDIYKRAFNAPLFCNFLRFSQTSPL